MKYVVALLITTMGTVLNRGGGGSVPPPTNTITLRSGDGVDDRAGDPITLRT